MSHKREEMIALFDSFDKNSDGKLTIRELKDGINAKFCKDTSDSEIATIFLDFDRDGDKVITKAEFLDQMCDKVCRKVAFNETFKEWDKDNSGYLSYDEVRNILKQQKFSEDQIKAMFASVDQNNDGKVSCEEFLKLM